MSDGSSVLTTVALLLLCLFASVIHASHVVIRRGWLRFLLPVGAAATLLLAQGVQVQAEWVGIWIFLLVAWQLLRGLSPTVTWVWSGMCTGLAAAFLVIMGSPWWLALPICLAITVATSWLSNQAGFAPTTMHHQAMLGLAWAAPCVAAAPGVMTGWQSAQRLNVEITNTSVQAIPAWSWHLLVAVLLLGVVRGIWGRR